MRARDAGDRMRRREFLQALARSGRDGIAARCTRSAADDADGERVLRGARAVRQRRAAAHHRLPRAAASRCYFREPSVNLGVGACARQAAASRRRGAAEAVRHRGRHARRARVHLSRLRARGARYGKVGGFAHLATLVKRLRGERPGRAAARRRRHLAGLGDGAVDAGARTWSTRRSCSAST